MSVKIKDFLKNTYYYIQQTLENDSFTKVSTKNGNVVIMPEDHFDCLIQKLRN